MEKALVILNTNSYILANFIMKKISHFFNSSVYFLDENLDKTTNQIINDINKKIDEQKINTCFFQGDYLSLINYTFISKTNFKRKYLFLTDDFDMHEVNSQTSLACDGIMTACPISKLKFNEKNLDASFYINEGDCDLFKDMKLKKDIDILFFGAFKADRNDYLNLIKKENLNIEIIKPEVKYLPYEKLVEYICRSKVVVNFSKTGDKNKFYSHKTYPYNYLQYKGRVHMAGMCGTLCVSEYSPAQEIIFGNDAPTFKTPNQMIDILKSLTSDDDKLKKQTNNFVDKCKRYCDHIYFPKVIKDLSLSNNRIKFTKLPYWYLRVFFIKSLRLYSNKKNIKNLYKEFFENILCFFKYSRFTFVFIVLEAIIHLLYLQLKIIKNKLVNYEKKI